jgi:hypothetical protein
LTWHRDCTLLRQKSASESLALHEDVLSVFICTATLKGGK